MPKVSSSKMLKFRNLLWKLHFSLEGCGQQIPFERLNNDPRYRAVILDKTIKTNRDASLVSLAEKLIEQEKILDIHHVLQPGDAAYYINDNASSSAAAPEEKTSGGVKTILLILSVLMLSFLAYFFSTTENATGEKVGAVSSYVTDNAQVAPTLPIKTILRLHGSNTIGEKLAPALIKAFLINSGATDIKTARTEELETSISANLPKLGFVNIEIFAHGSTTSFKALDKGLADIGMSSRKIKGKEVALLKPRYGDLTRPVSEHILGLDGLAIIVNRANPINSLNSGQLARLFSGEVVNWSQLGGDDVPVTVYAREANSGTWDTFKSLVLKKYNKKLTSAALRYESSSKLSDLVSENKGAIGFIGLPYVRQSKLLAVADHANTQAIFPTLFTVGTEDYPLSRRLYLYTPEKQTKIMGEFIEFTQSSVGQNIVKQLGFISQNIYAIRQQAAIDAPINYRELVKGSKRLSLNLRFKPGSNLLDNKSLRDIKRLIRYFSENMGKKLFLLGFSDSAGDEGYNLLLAEKRARTVESELQRRGIYVDAAIGIGEAMPVASNMTKAGRNKNRRVEIWVKG